MAFRLYDIDQNGCIEEREMVAVMEVCIQSLAYTLYMSSASAVT